jgi:hypothetical protein
MLTLLKGQPVVQQAYEKYKQFNQDETLRALDESRERFLHDWVTDMEISKAEGVAEGIAKGEIRATLKQRFGEVPQELKDAIQSMTDLVALESLLAHAENCKSLDEFGEVLK